jgi:hypothetical protein
MAGLRLGFKRRKPRDRTPVAISAVMITLTALKESADAFPPLKGAVAGVLHIVDLSQKVKSNKDDCQKLASRVQEILDKIALAVPDATYISPDLLARIDEFTKTLADIECFMERLCRVKVILRLLRHKEHEGSIISFNRRLDGALKSFMLISTLKIEMSVSQQGKRLSEEHKDLAILIHQNQLMQMLVFLSLVYQSTGLKND